MHLIRYIFCCIGLLGCSIFIQSSVFADESATPTGNTLEYNNFGEDKKKGVLGAGFAVVRFDTKVRITENKSGDSIFLDPEGNLGLPEIAHVNMFYGAYRLNRKSSIGISYFAVKRHSTFINDEINIRDVIILDGQASLSDDTKFYFFNYGHTLFEDNRSSVIGSLGISGLDLKYALDAAGQIYVDGVLTSGNYENEASAFAPLPLVGLDLAFAFTPKWSVATKVALVAGSVNDIKASALDVRINARYWFTKHIGGVIGLSSFNADVTIKDKSKTSDITYGFGGAYAGLHFAF